MCYGEEIAAHSNILTWKNSMDRGAWWATVHAWSRKESNMTEWARKHYVLWCGRIECMLSRVWLFATPQMDCSLPGSSAQGIFTGKNIGVGYHFLLQWIFRAQGSTHVSCIGCPSSCSRGALICVLKVIYVWTTCFVGKKIEFLFHCYLTWLYFKIVSVPYWLKQTLKGL